MISKHANIATALAITLLAGALLRFSDPPVPLTLKILESPAQLDSAEPNLALDETGTIYLSWLERLSKDSTALRFATLNDDESWSLPRTIATGSDWFVNWADFPAMAIQKDGLMTAHYLQRSGDSPYAYDVKMTTSNDGGASWHEAFLLHRDGTQSEHGFVSTLPWQKNQFFATWLDGRNTGGHESHDGHGGGAMTLRAAFFGLDGNLSEETELDNRICDCCQTAAVNAGDGAVVIAYRDRTENEVRDISTIRYKDGIWSAPRPVHEDQWEIAGCPVNGPAMDANQDLITIAWFTASGGVPRVLAASSDDQGVSFSDPVQIDSGKPLGRVDVAMLPDDTALVSWLEQTEEGAEVRIRRVAMLAGDKPETSAHQTVLKTSPARQSGFPKMVYSNDRIVFAWTQMLEERATQVQTAFYENAALQQALKLP